MIDCYINEESSEKTQEEKCKIPTIYTIKGLFN